MQKPSARELKLEKLGIRFKASSEASPNKNYGQYLKQRRLEIKVPFFLETAGAYKAQGQNQRNQQ